MENYKYPEQIDFLPYMGRWIVLASRIAALVGFAFAFFLLALDWATATGEHLRKCLHGYADELRHVQAVLFCCERATALRP